MSSDCAIRAAAEASSGNYVERFYIAQRRRSRPDCLGPLGVELHAKVGALAASSDRSPKRERSESRAGEALGDAEPTC